jgi:hypothetical protein
MMSIILCEPHPTPKPRVPLRETHPMGVVREKRLVLSMEVEHAYGMA